MAFVCVNPSGEECIFDEYPTWFLKFWVTSGDEHNCVELPKGTIKKLIGRDMSWKDKPVELKESIKTIEPHFGYYLARNKNGELNLFICHKPILDEEGNWWNGNEKNPNYGIPLEYNGMTKYKQVTFENSPIEIEFSF